MISIRKNLNEGFGTNQVNSLIPKIFDVLERRIGKKIFYASVPINFSNNEGFHSGCYALVEGNKAVRLNWKIGQEHSSITSVDIWLDIQEIPDWNIDVTGLNIVQIMDVIEDALYGKINVNESIEFEESQYKASIIKNPKGEYAFVGSGLPYDVIYCYENNPNIPLSKKDINELERASVLSFVKKTLHIKTRTFKTEKEAWDFLSNINKFEENIHQELKEKDMPVEQPIKRGRGRPRKGEGDRVLIAKGEKEKLQKAFAVPTREKYLQISSYIDLLRKGTFTGMLVAGRAGIGKTSNIINDLKSKGVDYEFISGGMKNAMEFYKFLWLYRDTPFLVFDDFDQILKDKKTQDLLKSALDTNPTKPAVVSFLSNKFLDPSTYTKLSKNKRVNDDRYVSNSFIIRSKLIIITNLPMEKLNSAVLSRTLNVSLDITSEEILASIEAHIEEFPPYDVDKKYKLMAIKLLKQHIKTITDIDFRDYNKVLAIASTNAPGWEKWAVSQLIASR